MRDFFSFAANAYFVAFIGCAITDTLFLHSPKIAILDLIFAYAGHRIALKLEKSA